MDKRGMDDKVRVIISVESAQMPQLYMTLESDPKATAAEEASWVSDSVRVLSSQVSNLYGSSLLAESVNEEAMLQRMAEALYRQSCLADNRSPFFWDPLPEYEKRNWLLMAEAARKSMPSDSTQLSD